MTKIEVCQAGRQQTVTARTPQEAVRLARELAAQWRRERPRNPPHHVWFIPPLKWALLDTTPRDGL